MNLSLNTRVNEAVPGNPDQKTPVYYGQLDGLRFLAVTGVLFQHFVTPLFSHYFLTGHAGVDLFFVISGFLITENLIRLKKAHDFGKAAKVFYARRVLRIFPLYFFYLILLTIFFYSLVKPSLPYAYFYIINFYDINHDLHPLVGHLWSLSVEEQFYIVWPFLILSVPVKYLKRTMMATFAFALLFILVNLATTTSEYVYFHTFSCMISLSSGGILAYYKIFEENRLKQFLGFLGKGWVFLFAILYLVISIGWQLHKVNEHLLILLRVLMCFIGFFLVGTACTGNGFKGRFGKWLNLGLVKKIGQVSYGIYIYHYLVSFVLMPYISRGFDAIGPSGILKYVKYNHTFFEFPLLMAITVGVALLSFTFFETPILRLKKYFT